MKASKLITLDVELINLLSKESNASGLINSLLMDYYEENIDNFEKELAKLKKKQAETRKKMRFLKQKQAKKAENLAKVRSLLSKPSGFYTKERLEKVRKEALERLNDKNIQAFG